MIVRMLVDKFGPGGAVYLAGSNQDLPKEIAARYVYEGAAVDVNDSLALPVTELTASQVAAVARQLAARNQGYGDALVEPPVSGITAAVGAGATLVSSAAATYNGETWWRVVVTATAGANNYVDLSIPTQTYAFTASDMLAEWACDDITKIQNLWYYMGTAAYAVNASVNITPITTGTTAAYNMNGVTGYPVR